MYSLPITTYSDYWRATKVKSYYLGGVAVLVASTQFSSPTASLPPTLQLPNHITSQSISSSGLVNSVGLQEPTQPVANQSVEEETIKIEIQEKEIPFETQYIESAELAPGTSEIQQKGETGLLRQVVKTVEVSGQPVDQQVQSSFVLKNPKNEVINRNTKPVSKKKVIIQNSTPISEDNVDISKLDINETLSVEATAYTYTGNNTATGIEPYEGVIAVDPRVIPMGSRVYVEGYGYAVAADTGGDIRGNRIDVFFSTLRQCINWGRKPVRIYVLNSN